MLFNLDRLSLQTFAGANWGAIGSFQWLDFPDQIGSISETSLVDDPIPGVYRLIVVCLCTTTSAATVKVTAKWRDSLGLQSKDLLDIPLTTAGTFSVQELITATPGSPSTGITCLATKSGSGGQYNLYVRAERL